METSDKYHKKVIPITFKSFNHVLIYIAAMIMLVASAFSLSHLYCPECPSGYFVSGLFGVLFIIGTASLPLTTSFGDDCIEIKYFFGNKKKIPYRTILNLRPIKGPLKMNVYVVEFSWGRRLEKFIFQSDSADLQALKYEVAKRRKAERNYSSKISSSAV